MLTIPFHADAVQAPDYSKSENWAALPSKDDMADRVPEGGNLKNEEDSAAADVFFIHPTSYLKATGKNDQWNADVNDEALNKKTDEASIFYQASVFNGAGKIYAPRYRQVHISSYFTNEHDNAKQAFDLAYSDVKRAFQYYLEHYNSGRPFIIASHSQGTTHAIRLLSEFIDGKPLSKQLVAAYLVGMPVYDTLYAVLKPCNNPNETGCYVTWRTYARDYFPAGYVRPKREAVCTNPLTWRTDSLYASYDLNKGGVLKNFNHIIPKLSDAQVADGVVRINKPHFFGNTFFNFKNYHIVDYNLFYINIRENAQLRVKSYLKKNK